MRVAHNQNPGFAQKLRELRAAKNWTQEELAERASLKRSHIQRLERGDYKESKLSTLTKLAKAFSIHPHIFIEQLGLISTADYNDYASEQERVAQLRISDPDIWLFFGHEWHKLTPETRELIKRFLHTIKQTV